MGGEIMWVMAAAMAASALSSYLNRPHSSISQPDYGTLYNQAKGDINNYTQTGANYLNPYLQGGQTGIGALSHMLGQFQNPEEYFNNFAKNYQMSPGAQNKLHTGLTSVQNAMAGQGLSGSGQEAKALTNYTQGVINEDMNQQFGNVLGAAHIGEGIGDTLYGGGLQAALGGSRLWGQAGEDIGGLSEAEAQAQAAAYAQQQEGQANSNSGIFGGIGGALGAMSSKF